MKRLFLGLSAFVVSLLTTAALAQVNTMINTVGYFIGAAQSPYFNTLAPSVSGGYLGPVPFQVVLGTKTNLSGTITGQEYYPLDLFIRDDEIVSNNIVGGLHVMHKFGATSAGSHHGLDVDLYQTAADANGAGSNFFTTGARVIANITASDGGTAITPNGKAIGLNSFVQCTQTAQYMQQCIGAEIDTQCASGTPGCVTRDKVGLTISEHDGGASVGASTFGAALAIASDNTVAGWQTGGGFGISFGSYSGFWPMNSSGTLIGCFTNQNAAGSCGTTAYGIDFAGTGNGGHSITFTGNAFDSNGFAVDGSGNLTAAGTTFTGASNINVSNNAAVNIGTGTTTSNVTLGGTANTVNIGGPLALATAGAVSAAAWTTNGIGLSGTARVYTDTSTASGTLTEETIFAFPASTIATTNAAVTITDLDELFLPTPVAGTNVTATRANSLRTAGPIRSAGLITGVLGANFTGATIVLNGNSNFGVNIGTGSSNGTIAIGGGSGTNTLVNTTTINANQNFNTNINSGTSSGTVTIGGASTTAINMLGPVTINSSQNSTIGIGIGTDSSTVTIGGGSNAVTINSTTLTLGGSTLVTSSSPVTMSNAAIKMTGITTGTNADTVCLKADGTLLIQAAACTISSRRFKDNIKPFDGDALLAIEALPVQTFNMKPNESQNADHNYATPQIGLIAEDVEKIAPLCAIYDDDMKTPKSYRETCLIGLLVKAQQEASQKARNQQLEIFALGLWCLGLTAYAARRRKPPGVTLQ